MKTTTAVMFSLLLAAPLFADDTITVFGGGFSRDWVSRQDTSINDGTYRAINKREWNGEIGLALSHAWSPRWSAEGSVALRQNHMYVMEWIPVPPLTSFAPVTAYERVRTIPFDASMRYHFVNDSRWKPYVSAGARYVKAPGVQIAYIGAPDANGAIPVRTRRPDNRLSAEAGAGLALRLTRTFGVRADVKRLLRNDDSPFDPLNRATFGMEWKY